MAGSRVALWVAGFALGVASCLPDAVYVCELHQHCGDLGRDARCEAIGYCSTIDANCDSGRRFHEYAGDGLGGQCTDAACGNGEIDPGEECDDGNDVQGDGCNNDCRVSGQELWTASYASPGNVRDRCYGVAVDSQGVAAVIGHITEEPDNYKIWIRQYFPDGSTGWTWSQDGEGTWAEEAWAIRSLPGDTWLATGSIATADDYMDLWVGTFNSIGQTTAAATFESNPADTYHDVGRDVVVAPNGDVIIVGVGTPTVGLEEDILIQRRSPDLQTVRWTTYRTSNEMWAQDRGHGVVAVDGGFVGVGKFQTSEDGGPYWAWIERFDDDGNTVWDGSTSRDDANALMTAVTVTPNDTILLAGRKETPAGDADMWLQARDPAGNVLWEEMIGSPGGDEDSANAIVADERGGFIVGGEMGAGAGSSDAWIRRYGPDREEIWTLNYSGPAGDRDTTWGLALAPDGSVWACGYESTPESDWDIWVRRLTP